MDTLSYKTKSANPQMVTKAWHLVDAENEILGRLASMVAHILRGKNKTYFTPHMDCGDHIVVINAEKIRMTGNKLTAKQYVRHTGYPGGQRFSTPREILKKKPISLVEMAVKRMLPKNKLGNAIYKNLHVYAGTEHPHQAQQPQPLNINTIK